MIKDELGMGYKPVPLSVVNKLSKSICKITYTNNENKNAYGTGFFMLLKSSKFLIPTYHVINGNIKNKSIKIEIYNKNKINLKLESRFIKLFKKSKDISIVEIKDSDGIFY